MRITFYLLYIAFWILYLIGYIKNIIKLCGCDFDSAGSWKAEILHGIGVFGLGGFLGWFDFGV
jgi:hypothetical protein